MPRPNLFPDEPVGLFEPKPKPAPYHWRKHYLTPTVLRFRASNNLQEGDIVYFDNGTVTNTTIKAYFYHRQEPIHAWPLVQNWTIYTCDT